MNITLDTQYSLSHTADTDNTTTYRTTAEPTQVWGSGYSLDITDKVMDDKAYQGHGMTTQDIMSKAENTNVQAQKDFMIVMSNSVSGEDLEKMQEEGFDPESTDVETYVSIVDRIKVTLARAGVQIAGYNDDLDMATVEEITGSQIDANELIDRMQQADLPVTKENVEALVETILKAAGLRPLSQDAMKYMILNSKAPTIENLYLAQHSSAATLKQSKGYFSDYGKGYYAKKADSINWDNLQNSIDSVISQSGLANNNKIQENAKWLIESGIELDADNLTLMSDLKNLELPIKPEEILNLAVTAMQNGKQPAKALVTGEQPVADQAAQLIEDVRNISDEAIHETVEAGVEINLKNLTAAQKQIDVQRSNGKLMSGAVQNVTGEVSQDQTSIREIEARRQLEEIRLMMTEEANRQLLKSGYQIDTTELSQLVEALKKAEINQKAALFQGETTEINDERALWYENTLTVTEELASMPAALVGKIAASKTPYTLEMLHQEGLSLQSKYEKAGETYEALMTAPRKDLGDQIQKAFRNVDDILADMELEINDSNRRAVRILGYNSMEITKDNIDAVKEADIQVTGVMRRMTPATTLQMIREQKNPLEMNLDELSKYLTKEDNDTGKEAEKYSKYLQKLDRSNSITDDEREAYIGIYRLFRQIEKSDGAVIGSVVASGAEMNFKNMLSAVRSNKNKNMDISIDQDYGGLEKLIAKGEAIDKQIMAGFENEGNQDNSSEEFAKQTKYYARLSGEIKDELAQNTSVETLQSLDIRESTTIEQFAGELKQTAEKWQDADKAALQTQERLHEFRESVQAAQEIEDAVIQSLIDYDQPISVGNIQAASLLLMERGALYKQIFGRSGAASVDHDTAGNDVYETVEEAEKDSLWQTADQMVESLNDRKSAVSAYKELVGEASKAVENMIYASDSVIDVKAAQALYKGLSLAGNLAKEENYELPVNIKGEITSVNLKIYHNSSRAGKVTVTMDTDILGKVAADFDISNDRVSGMIAYDRNFSGSEMEELKASLEQEFYKAQQENGTEKTISVSLVETKVLDLSRFGQDRDVEETQRLSTRELYQTAKAFMTALKGLDEKQETQQSIA